jgi:type I restriction enzyme M protein
MVENFNGKVDFIWSIADLLRGDYKQSEYQKVILPLTVLRRLDCVTEQNKEEVLLKYEELEERGISNIDNVEQILKNVSGHPVYNTSEYTFEKLCKEQDQLAENLKYYIDSFNPNTREIIEKFEFNHQIDRLDDANLLYKVVQSFTEIDLHPDDVDNEEMGYIYEELIRKFSELSNETAGEHFTPREVIELMVRLIFAEDDSIDQPYAIRDLYDPACGTGGMLSVADKSLIERNPDATLEMFGQELNPESYAVCNSDMLIKGQDPDRIVYGNSFTEDGFRDKTFDYMLSNPPFGVSWKKVKEEIEREHDELGDDGRFGAGTPRVNDGSMLFLQHMLSKRKPPKEGGSRIAIVFNGSPLFNGGPNSGESAIRRWILENDWLEAIVGLPENLFYNTGIRTYIWVLSNNKPKEREGQVQLIDARELYREMDESLGDKRHELSEEHIKNIQSLFTSFEEAKNSKIIDGEEFGYRRIVIERPLRLSLKATKERIESLHDEKAFTNRDEDIQERVKEVLAKMDSEKVWLDREKFMNEVELQMNMAGLDLRDSVYNSIERALGRQNRDGEICRDNSGSPEPDTDLREYERIPIDSDAHEYFENEVNPHLENAWLSQKSRYVDDQDGQLGLVGYEINFNKYFYELKEHRELEEIDEEISVLGAEISDLLEDITQ